MKETATILTVAAVIFTIMPMNVYASDYQGKEKEESIFQKMGDFITGKYEVNGKPIKKTGVFQPMADEVKNIAPAPVK